MNDSQMRFPNFSKKALTFSYDDGVRADKRLIAILDKYGLKGTFNINDNGFVKEATELKMPKEETINLYKNTKLHSYTHPSLAELDQAIITHEIIKDREALEDIFGCVVKGMAYPNGSIDDRVVETLRICGVEYARTIVSTEKFDIPPTGCVYLQHVIIIIRALWNWRKRLLRPERRATIGMIRLCYFMFGDIALSLTRIIIGM